MSFGGRKTFLYFLCDAPTGRSYYVAPGGQILLTNTPTWLQRSPQGWLENMVAFGRSASYFGINRTFTVPLKFVSDGAKIVRYLFYNKRGIEQPVMLVVLKWNPDTDVYELYYKGVLDLTKIDDKVSEGVIVNVMEGGVLQLLRAYENTVFQIPSDGSIPENIKVKFDGILFNDTFHYTIIPVTTSEITINGLRFIVPAVFTGNEGDSIGIIHADPTYEEVPPGPIGPFFLDSQNWTFYSTDAIQLTFKGKLKVRPSGQVDIFFRIHKSDGTVIGDLIGTPSDPFAIINTVTEFTFNETITLPADNNLFLAIFLVGEGETLEIIEANFDISFSSRYRSTDTWSVSAFDLFKLIVKAINEAASNTIQQFNYQVQSQLLQQYLNLSVCSGDALRAGSDVNYPGPVVIKTSLKDFFDSFNPILNAALGNQTLPGQQETLFFEAKGYVFDSSVVTMDIGEVSDFSVSVALDHFFNVLKIGYPNQQYEEKAGKNEYNTTAQWSAPIITLAKELSLVSKYRADPHGIEYTRFNTGGRSTTHNASDNSVFVLNIDRDSASFSKYQATNELDISLPSGQILQPVALTEVEGDFCTNNEEFTIFTFANNLNTPQFTARITVIGNVAGAGSISLSVWINGVEMFSVIGNPGAISLTNQLLGIIFSQGDTIEVKYTTILATAVLITVTLELISEQILSYPLKRVVYDAVSGLPNADTYFNIEDLTPKRMLARHFNYLKSTLYNQIPDSISFQSLDRNQDLSTTLAGQTITENANVPINSMTPPLFYGLIFEFKTKVPINFMDLMSGAANGHIRFTYNGVEFFGFPIQVSQKPALNESQQWKLLCSPASTLEDLTDLDIDGLNFLDMAGLSTFIPHLCPVHFVPLGYANPNQYHHLTMDQDWFKNRITKWVASNDYYNPWQTDDVIKIQLQTNGLGPVQVEILNCHAEVINTIALNPVPADAVKSPNILYQGNVPLAGLDEDLYYLLITAGTGLAVTKFISEALWVKESWPETLLLEYKHNANKQAVIFSEGYQPSFRVDGRIVRYTPGARFAVYEDEPADIELLNGIPYDTHKLEIGLFDGGVPDYVIRKLGRILLLSDTTIDGKAYTRDKESDWERVNFPGQPKEYWSLDIRDADNLDGITLSTDGTLDQNVSIVYNIDANAFGENSGVSNVIQVEQQNI